MSPEVSSRVDRLGAGSYFLHLWTVFGIALSNILLAVAVLVVPWTRRRYWERLAALRPIALPVALYAGVLGLAVIDSHDRGHSARALTEFFNFATIGLAPLVLVGLRRVRLAVDGLLWSSGAFAVWGLGQFLVGYGDIDQRIRGPFSHVMTFAGVLLMADFVLIARLVTRPSERRRWYWWMLLFLINAALVGSLTRSAWLAVAVTLTALLALKAPRLLPAYLPAAALFFLLAPAPVVSRVISIGDLKDVSNYDRLCFIEAGIHMTMQQPLLGVGPRMVAELYPLYRHPTSPRIRTPHLHNTFVQVAAERGLISLAAYLWMFGVVLLLAYRGYRRASRADESGGNGGADLFLGALLGLVAFQCAGLFEDNWGDTEVQRVTLLLAAVPLVLSARPTAGEGRGAMGEPAHLGGSGPATVQISGAAPGGEEAAEGAEEDGVSSDPRSDAPKAGP